MASSLPPDNGARGGAGAPSRLQRACPAASDLALPDDRYALSLGLLVGLTFSFDLMIGIGIYTAATQSITGG